MGKGFFLERLGKNNFVQREIKFHAERVVGDVTVRGGRESFRMTRPAEGRILLGRMKVGYVMEKDQLLGLVRIGPG